MSDLFLFVLYGQIKKRPSDMWAECALIPHSLYYTREDAKEAKEGLTEDLEDKKMMRYTIKTETYDYLATAWKKELIKWGDSGDDCWVIGDDLSIDMLETDEDEEEEFEDELQEEY